MPQSAFVTCAVFVTILGLGVGHFVGIGIAAIQRETFVYDVRFYSQLLVGALLVVPSVFALLQVRGLRAGSRIAWQRALVASLVVLAVNLPLIPTETQLFPFRNLDLAMGMVAFGTIVSGLAGVNAGSLLFAGRSFPRRKAAV